MEKSSMKVIKKLSFLIVFITCTACGQEIPGLNELKKLCEKDAGLTINKTVEVDGYYDSTAIGVGADLIESSYRFKEFCNDNPKFTRAIPEPGCWRVSKVKRELGQCYERLDKRLAKYVVEPYPEFLKDHCLAVEKIEKPEARYKYEVERKEWWIDERNEIKMSLGIGRIVDIKTGEVLGEAKNYVLRPKNSTPPSFHCGSAHVTGSQKTKPFAVGLIEKTLILRKDEILGESK
jgi:hypothetical protein